MNDMQELVYETIIHWEEGGGKRSRRELARRIVDLYAEQAEKQAALDRMADNARELGLDYTPKQEPLPDGLPMVIAGAIFDFAGYLTTREKVIEVGSTAEAGPMADLVKEWSALRGLSLADAAVLSWQELLRYTGTPQQEKQEPVAWMTPTGALYRTEDVDGCFDETHIPLYTAPPQRQPLTEEQIEDEWERHTGHSIFGGDRGEGRTMYLSPDEVVEFARAIEAAHGIGGEA